MGRVRTIEYQGRKYGLKKGESWDELLEQLEFSLTVYRPPIEDTDAPKSSYYSFHNGVFVPRNSFKRKHHKSRSEWEKLDRPKFGAGSGRAGGARMATHKRSHLKFWPGTTPLDCPVCRRGLAAVLNDNDPYFDLPWMSIDELERRPQQIRPPADMAGVEI